MSYISFIEIFNINKAHQVKTKLQPSIYPKKTQTKKQWFEVPRITYVIPRTVLGKHGHISQGMTSTNKLDTMNAIQTNLINYLNIYVLQPLCS